MAKIDGGDYEWYYSVLTVVFRVGEDGEISLEELSF
jgi:hypothetical protein